MEELINEIQAALDNNLYYLALYVTLTIPDICAAISSGDGKTSKKQYMAWYEKYAQKHCSKMLDAESCYYFRCSSLHQGSTQNEKSKFERILFLKPDETRMFSHDNFILGALNIDLKTFCQGMLIAIKEWMKKSENDSIFIKNIETFMKVYPNGIPPYIIGTPVIS